jgi:hypothetical protein
MPPSGHTTVGGPLIPTRDVRGRQVVIPSGDRILFSLTALWFVTLSFVGFSRSFYFRALPEPLPLHQIVHGVVYSAWVVLFLVQAVLISTHRKHWHFALGSVGAFLLMLMIPVGFYVVLAKASAGLKSTEEAGFNLTSLAVGFTLAFAGLANRRRPFVHKRLMVFATLMLTVAAADRVALVLGFEEVRLFRKVLAAAPGIALIAYDAVSQRRIPILSLTLLALVWLVIWFVISDVVFMGPTGDAVVRALTRVFVW